MDSDSSAGSSPAALGNMRSRNGSTIRLHDDPSRRRLDSSDEAGSSLRSLNASLPPYSGTESLGSALSPAASSSSKQSLNPPLPGIHRADAPAPLELTPKAQPSGIMDHSLDATLTTRSRSDTVQTESSFGSPTTARSAYYDAASSVEGDARSVTSAQSGRATPDYAGSAGSHTPRLGGHAELGESPPRPHERSEPVTPPRQVRRHRESVASTASDHSAIAYPPNHGSVGIDLFEAAARRGHGPAEGQGPEQWYGSDPYAYHSGSTLHLPADAVPSSPTFGPSTPQRTPGGLGRSDHHTGVGVQVLQIRHSNSFEHSRAEYGRYSLDRSDKDGSEPEDDLVVHHYDGRGGRGTSSFDHPYRSHDRRSSTTPRIVVAGDDDDSLHEWDGADATKSHGGDQTGVILGSVGSSF